MTAVTIQDAEGATMTVSEVEGFYLPAGRTAEHLEEVKHLEIRPDDIFLCVYPKSGTNWVREITSMLLVGTAKMQTDPLQRKGDWVELPRKDFGAYLSQRSSPRLLISHRPFSYLPEKAREQRNKIIFVQRDIKDVAVSFYHMALTYKPANYEGTWNGFATNFLQGKVPYSNWFDQVKSYRGIRQEDPNYPIHYMNYEDLQQNAVREIERLSRFLELPEDQALVEDIASQTKFSVMKAFFANNQIEKELLKIFFKSGRNELYRKGVVGDWKNLFTVAQSEAFDAEYEKQMGHKYGEDPF